MRVFRTTSLIVPGSTAVDPTPTDGCVHWFYDVIALERILKVCPSTPTFTNLPGDVDVTTFLFNSCNILLKWQTCKRLLFVSVKLLTQILTAISGSFSIVDKTIVDTSHTMDSEVEVIDIAIPDINTAVSFTSITGDNTRDIPLVTDSSDHIIVHTFSTIHWRLETDHS